MQTLYIRLPCLRALWSLSTRLPNLKIILQSGPSVFKFNLKRAVIFLHKNFRVCNRSKQGELVPPRNFWIRFFKSNFKNACWALPKPDIQHKIAPAARFRWYRISNFSLRKICSMKIGVDSFNIASKRKYHFLKNRAILWYALSRAVHKNRTSQVRFSPSKPDLSGPKKFFESVISYQQDTNWTLKTEWLSAWDTRRRPHKGEPENAAERGAGTPCRENGTQNLKLRWYAKPELIVPILPWNSFHIP